MAQLAPIVLGLGAVEGYSGEDLTNPHTAALRGEIPYLPLGEVGPDTRPLELRVHGVGGAPPSDNLETPNTLQIAGDGSAGFFRPWHPGGAPHPDVPRREAYCWGKLNVGSWTRALWLLLVAFMIINVAFFALPRERAGKFWSALGSAVSRALLRLVALSITLAFVGTSVTVVADFVAWQGPASKAIPTWLHFYTNLGTGPRLAYALWAVLLVPAALTWLSVHTARAYERWDDGSFPDPDPVWPLTRQNFWRGELTVTRQRNAHLIAAMALVQFIAVAPESAHGAVRAVLLGVAAGFGALAVGLVASPWADRVRATQARHRQWSDRIIHVVTVVSVVAAILVAGSRIWWVPTDAHRVLPGSHRLQIIVVLSTFGLLVVLALVVLCFRPWDWRAGRGFRPMGFGFTAVLLGVFASVVATVFGSAFTLTVANLLGKPRVSYCTRGTPKCGKNVLFVPSHVYAGGAGMISATVLLIVFGSAVWFGYRPWLARRYRTSTDAGSVRNSYGAAADDGRTDAIAAVARTWATSKLTDLAPEALFWLAVPTAAVVIGYEAALASDNPPGPLIQNLAAWGGTIGVAAVGYFVLQLRTALTSASGRKRFGFFWDVGTFFPRACAPFGPPCYAERSVPEIVTRIRRIVGDVVRETPDRSDPALALQAADEVAAEDRGCREAQTNVLLVGYSQGTPISVAVMAQLPRDVIDRTALLTLAAPVRRLYGRAFPAYFGRECIAVLRDRLTDPGRPTRWRTLVRRSDYIGAWVVAEPWQQDGAGLDAEITDPPVLWPNGSPTQPPTHRHSDWFPDPQTRPHADELAATILGPPRGSVDLGVDGEGGARNDSHEQRGDQD